MLVGLVEARCSPSSRSNHSTSRTTADTRNANEWDNSHPVHRNHDVVELVNDRRAGTMVYECYPFFTIYDTAFTEVPNQNPKVVKKGETCQAPSNCSANTINNHICTPARSADNVEQQVGCDVRMLLRMFCFEHFHGLFIWKHAIPNTQHDTRV